MKTMRRSSVLAQSSKYIINYDPIEPKQLDQGFKFGGQKQPLKHSSKPSIDSLDHLVKSTISSVKNKYNKELDSLSSQRKIFQQQQGTMDSIEPLIQNKRRPHRHSMSLATNDIENFFRLTIKRQSTQQPVSKLYRLVTFSDWVEDRLGAGWFQDKTPIDDFFNN
ncbi:hypothetical protein pb186bvf_000188 [Paramecium bursaria]